MSEQDELAEVIVNVFNDQAAFIATPPNVNFGQVELANHLIAAGYRRPRTITTAEELIALPDHSVIRDKFGDVAEKRGSWWCSYETAPCGDSRQVKFLPATVLHDGGAA